MDYQTTIGMYLNYKGITINYTACTSFSFLKAKSTASLMSVGRGRWYDNLYALTLFIDEDGQCIYFMHHLIFINNFRTEKWRVQYFHFFWSWL